jgi:DNA replication and repair protein RecF
VYLRHLALANFRCYRSLSLDLPCRPIVVVGENAQGKSSLLEAVYVLATTRSPQAGSDRELVHWAALAEALPYSRVVGDVVRATGHETIEVVNVRQPGEPGEERFAKQVRLNGAVRRALDVVGRLNVVLFTPQDIELVRGPPAERRRYMDVLLCQVDPGYCRTLAAYNRVLAQRNHLLRRLRERGGDRAELAFWDERLAAEGGRILARRQAAIRRLDRLAQPVHQALSGEAAALEVHYRPRLVEAPEVVEAAEPAALAEALARSLAARREAEVLRGITLSGPHRDDLGFQLDGVDLRTYGSRGQQRTATLAMKLAEAQLMEQETGERPVLLLDDVLSELDGRRQAGLLGYVREDQQTLITTTSTQTAALAELAEPLVLVVAGAAVSAAGPEAPVAP